MWVACSFPASPRLHNEPSHWDAGFSETETKSSPYLAIALHEMLHDFTFSTILWYCFFQVLVRCLCWRYAYRPILNSFQSTKCFFKSSSKRFLSVNQSIWRWKLQNPFKNSHRYSSLKLFCAVRGLLLDGHEKSACEQLQWLARLWSLLVLTVFTHVWGHNWMFSSDPMGCT